MRTGWVTAVAVAAAILTTGSWLPQVIKTWKTRRAEDFSWAWLTAFSSGVALWAVYGFMREDVAIIVTNVLTLGLVLSIIGVKMKQ